MTATAAAAASPAVAAGLDLVVADAASLCEDIRQVVLVPPSGTRLPSFTPGGHIAVTWAPGQHNSYSLTGPAVEPDHYSISVRLDPTGRGGSAWMHGLAAGDRVTVSRPRSAFAPIPDARHHVLVAGGIGVTPILSHVRAAVQWGRSFEVVYSYREGSGAHVDDLIELCGDRLTVVGNTEQFWAQMAPILVGRPVGTHLYTCGPRPMIDAVGEAALGLGWPRQRVHSEPFSSGVRAEGNPFTARLSRTGSALAVASRQSLLEALLDQGFDVPNLCRQGVCGECRLTVRGGGIDHRDLYLTEEEKAAGDAMMPCVSRATGPDIELEL